MMYLIAFCVWQILMVFYKILSLSLLLRECERQSSSKLYTGNREEKRVLSWNQSEQRGSDTYQFKNIILAKSFSFKKEQILIMTAASSPEDKFVSGSYFLRISFAGAF